MIKALITILVGAALIVVPEPIVSSSIGVSLIVKGVKMLRNEVEGDEDEPPDHLLIIKSNTLLIQN